MQLVQSFLTQNPCYTCGTKLRRVCGLMLHSVGCPQPSADVFIRNWNKPTYDKACVHAFIDANTGVIKQTLPWDRRGWHGYKGKKGCCNDTHIGVEMCEPACIKYTGGANFICSDLATAQAAARRTYQSAVELFAMLCKTYNLNPLADGVVISHKEGAKRGNASGHADPEHLWTQLKLPYTMDTFRADVKKAMGSTTMITTPSGPVTPPVTGATAVSFRVQIKVTDLNIRSGPGTNHPSKGKIKPGVYTITEVANGPGATQWGKLKSGVGWISLDYAKKI